MTAPEEAAPVPADAEEALRLIEEAKTKIADAAFRRSVRSGRSDLNAALHRLEAVRAILTDRATRPAQPEPSAQEDRIREDELDAERYRYLRDNCVRKWRSNIGAPDSLSIDYDAEGHDLNAAIDASLDRSARLRGEKP